MGLSGPWEKRGEGRQAVVKTRHRSPFGAKRRRKKKDERRSERGGFQIDRLQKRAGAKNPNESVTCCPRRKRVTMKREESGGEGRSRSQVGPNSEKCSQADSPIEDQESIQNNGG